MTISIQAGIAATIEAATIRPHLNRPEERLQAAEVLRPLIEKIVLTPGPKRGQIDAVLYGELGTILNWVEQQAVGNATKRHSRRRPHGSVSLIGFGVRICSFLSRWVGYAFLRGALTPRPVTKYDKARTRRVFEYVYVGIWLRGHATNDSCN
ncbi:hypothetical protein [Rhizobium leguminosarum]|uniref:hypothetical protein n=1 Tax=Rhizobium leguminosarum TaxID=384 RepID=UPI001981CB45|nr:hypothetical protein [Rhizobium leguminosarum]